MILATEPPLGENLAKAGNRCKMFHVEHRPMSVKIGLKAFAVECSTWNIGRLVQCAAAPPSDYVSRGTSVVGLLELRAVPASFDRVDCGSLCLQVSETDCFTWNNCSAKPTGTHQFY